MDVFFTLWLLLIGVIIGFVIGIALSFRHAVTPLQQKIGRLTTEPEQDSEKMKYYPYNLQRFRFIGDPVDGIQFEENKILFVQLKATRTAEQNRLKKLVEDGKIGWFEYS